MKKLPETTRTYLREFLPEDSLNLYHLNADPEVIRYTGDPPFKDEAAAADFLKDYSAYAKWGIGRWAVIRKENPVFLGWCGLKYHPQERVVDVGFRFFKKFWGQGYATETASAVMEYGFKNLRYPFLVAHAHVDNGASQRVLEKCGMYFVKDFIYEGQPAKMYRIENPDYRFKRITAAQILHIRHPVLLQGQAFEKAKMGADDASDTLHYGAFHKGILIGVATLMKDDYPDFEGTQCRLRGMAVLPKYGKKGLAEILLNMGIADFKENGYDLLWFNARIGAVPFYKKLGFATVGNIFDMPGIGDHYVMKRKL